MHVLNVSALSIHACSLSLVASTVLHRAQKRAKPLPGPSNGTVAADAHQDDDDDKNINWQRRQQHHTVLPSDVTVI